MITSRPLQGPPIGKGVFYLFQKYGNEFVILDLPK
jgi:hypothetical protein